MMRRVGSTSSSVVVAGQRTLLQRGATTPLSWWCARSLGGARSFSGFSSAPLSPSLSSCCSLVATPRPRCTVAAFSSKAKELDKAKLSTGKSSARGKPRFEMIRNLLISMACLFGAAGLMYVLRWGYYYMRPEGNDRAIVKRLQEEMWLRPHWCAAMVYAVAHHALCDPRTPFGSPLLAPARFEPELREILKLLRELQLDHPGTSLPDLWAATATYAVANLGGPLLGLSWGRMEEEFPPDPVVVSAPKVSSYTADVRTVKRTLGGRTELAADEMVAILGHRTLGVHGGAHGEHQLGLMREASAEMVDTGKFAVKETSPSDECPGVGSSTPGVFDNDYYVCLERDGWAPVARVGGLFGGGSAGGKPKNPGEAPPEPAVDCDNAKQLGLHTSAAAPCVAMQPLDVALKTDLMMLPWVQKFSENEVRFFNAYSRAVSKILRSGWEGWNLREG